MTKTLVLMSISYRSDTLASDLYLIDIDLSVSSICVSFILILFDTQTFHIVLNCCAVASLRYFLYECKTGVSPIFVIGDTTVFLSLILKVTLLVPVRIS